MEIVDFIGEYPNINSNKFQKEIAHKKEFADLQLEKYEQPTGSNFKHQMIVERFLSDKTKYGGLLVFHGLGTGKTRTSILVSEINKGKTRALILAKSSILLNNYKSELASYDVEQYAPKDNFGKLLKPSDKELYTRRINALTQKHYEFETFERFTKNLRKMTDEQIEKVYSYRVIVIDEAHNLRIQEGKQETKTQYFEVHRLLHAATNLKIMLLTGTPIWDDVSEISSIMNLLLPLDKQLDVSTFETNYFRNEKIINETQLEDKFKNLISYVRQSQSDVEKEYQGDNGKTEHLNLVTDEMSRNQYEGLKIARSMQKTGVAVDEDDLFGEDVPTKKGGIEGLRTYEIEAANFYWYRANMFGKAGFMEHAKPTGTGGKQWAFKTKEIADDVRDNLKKYSSKMYSTVQHILEKPNESVFVYHPQVKAGGTFLFGLVLEQFGFVRTRSDNVFSSPSKRYAIISSDAVSTKSETQQMINAFNDPRNKNGEYIQVLIGSRQISEGITLKNVQQCHIMVPHWNLSAIDQAIGRAVRFGSHEALGGKNKVKVFLHAASYKDKNTVDIDLYRLAENKDFKTKQVYRILKKVSMDCPLNYKRNVSSSDKSHTRECDYEECNYECSQFESDDGTYTIKELDTTTFDLYYNKEDVLNTITYLEYMFQFKTHISLSHILAFFKDKTFSTVIQSLVEIIHSKTVIKDKFGMPAFLKEYNNLYFLDKNSSLLDNDYNNTYYTKTPIIKEDMNLSDIVDLIRMKTEKKKLETLCTLENKKEISEKLKEIDYKVRIGVLETAYHVKKQQGSNVRVDTIVEDMGEFLYKVDNQKVVDKVLDEVLEKISKERNVPQYLSNFSAIVKIFTDKYNVELDTLLNIYKSRAVKKTTYKREMNTILKSLKIDVKPKTTTVHVLMSSEPQGTQYKRSVKPTGMMRQYTGGSWEFVPRVLEEEYLEQMKEKDSGKFPTNYEAYGTLKGDKFRVVTKGKTGFICKSASNKSNIVSIIAGLIKQEIEFENSTTFEIQGEKLYSKEQYITMLRDKYKTTNKSIEELSILYELNSYDKDTLCSMLQKWFEQKGLIF